MKMKLFRYATLVAVTGSLTACLSCGNGGGSNAFLPPSDLLNWTRLMGVASQTAQARAVAVDIDGNSYVTGYTSGALDGEPLSGPEDMFIVKYNAEGEKQWTRLFGVSGASTHGMGIFVNATNLYVSGSTSGNLDGKTKTGDYDAFVMVFDLNGAKQWTKLLGVSGATTESYGVAVWAGAWIFVTGYTTGNLCGDTKTGNRDAFLVRYNSDGSSILSHNLFGASGANSYATAITANAASFYMTGYTNGNLNGETLNGTQDAFVIRFGSDCSAYWTRLFGVSGKTTRAYGIANNTNGYAYVTGYTDGGLNGETVTGIQDLFVMKIATDGDVPWTRLLGVASKVTNGLAIINDNNDIILTTGHCWAAGYTTGDLDGKKLRGTADAFVVEYESTGAKLSTKLLGVASADTRAYGIGCYMTDPGTSLGTFSVAGYTTGDLGGEDVTGAMDLFVTTKLNN